MRCRKNSPGKPCCFSCHSCAESTDVFNDLTFTIASGLHPLSFTRPLRLGNSAVFCGGEFTSTQAAITSLQLPVDLNTMTCCASRYAYVFNPSDDSSSAIVAESRSFAGEYHLHTSGSTTRLCEATGIDIDLPFENNIDIEADVYVAMGVRRVVDFVNLKVCMVSIYDVPYTQIECEIGFRILRRTYTHSASPSVYDCWAMQFSTLEAPCTPLIKLCASSCGFIPLKCGESCENICTADDVDPVEITEIENRCDYIRTVLDVGSGGFSCPYTCRSNFKSDDITVFSKKQRRRILLPEHCTIPAEITFTAADTVPYSLLEGDFNDITVGYDPPDTLALGCDPAVALTGDTSAFTVYEADVEDWTVALS